MGPFFASIISSLVTASSSEHQQRPHVVTASWMILKWSMRGCPMSDVGYLNVL